MHISFGNKKLPTSTAIFNLPAVKTCPGRTALCAQSCYALKAERLYKEVIPCRKNNLKSSFDPSFVDLMIGKIIKSKRQVFRVHESGDFYRQAYLDKWFTIARRIPSVTFYAYTKSFMLDFSAKPKNFVLIASFDATTTAEARAMYKAKKRFFANTFSIVDKDAPASCIQDCTKCSACWTARGKNITVNKH